MRAIGPLSAGRYHSSRNSAVLILHPRRRCPQRQPALAFHAAGALKRRGGFVKQFLRNLWAEEQGQDIAEYAVMLAVILVIVVGTIRLIGSNANNVFSSVGSSIQ
jgi:Flp pilus assembly pilin Flp